MRSVRKALVAGLISYRGLFGWISPGMYVATLIGSPIFQMLAFVFAGRALGAGSDAFFVIGNAVLACSLSTINGAVQLVANDRAAGTLVNLVAAPRGRVTVLLGRMLPSIASGLITSVTLLIAGSALTTAEFATNAWPALFCAVVAASVSSCGLGLLVGLVGLCTREIYGLGNLIYFALLLLSGANVAKSDLPSWLKGISSISPTSHAISAGRAAVTRAPAHEIVHLLGAELAVGALYGCLALALFGLFERLARSQAQLELS